MIAGLAALIGLVFSLPLLAQTTQPQDPQLDQFKRAWQAARTGDRARFEQIKSGLGDYVLYPYLQYEDFRFRRSTIQPAEMASFLDEHTDMPFTAGLRTSWLLALGASGQWDAVLLYAPGEQNTEVQCYLLQARIQRGEHDVALPQAQDLWAVGRSQPDVCDPGFTWLRKEGGITPELTWLRIQRAMEAGNPRLAGYLAKFLPLSDRVWAERWQQQDQQKYTRIDQVRQWPDQFQAWDIASSGLSRLARSNASLAWRLFESVDGKIAWSSEQRADVLREIALWSAVANEPDTLARMYAVPAAARDDSLLEWWARSGLASGNWAEVILAVASMSEEFKNSERWRYWDARARLQLGDQDYALGLMDMVSGEASYYGFLAADYLQRPYAICNQDPGVTAEALLQFGNRPAFQRVVELQRAGLDNWSRSEWFLGVKLLDPEERRLAGALAIEQGRPDLAILALNGGGDRKLYDWRFPLAFVPAVQEQAGKRHLDTAWVMGLMRSESAMNVAAVSPAGARGLMQLMPATAAQLARRYGYAWQGSEQLMQAKDNIVFGTSFLRELMDRFGNNPVLVSGAYNAGPGAVKRWLKDLPGQDAAIWIEMLPFFETRDYIPRVLAFATIYDWRLQQPVQRISSRMPAPDSATKGAGPAAGLIADVVCPEPTAALLPGS